MSVHRPLILLLLFVAACAAPPPGPATAPEPVTVPEPVTEDRARTLARAALIVDTHIDVPYRLYRKPADVSERTEDGDFDYPRAVTGGLDAVFMSIYVPADVDAAGEAGPLADQLIDAVEALAADHPDKFAMATCAADLEALQGSGRLALALGMENGGPLAGSLDALDHYAERGIRYITLAHSRSNHISDSSYDGHERWGGLSPFGKTLIAAMNQRGVMIDVSHVTDRAFWQVLELSATPIIASHSSLRHFTPGFQRNMSDDMVQALARNGGVVQINFGSGFLTAAARQYSNEREIALQAFRSSTGVEAGDPRILDFYRSYATAHPFPYATVDDVLDHIDRAVQLAGIDHVGLGSDYDGVGDSLPVGLKDVSSYPTLVAGLLGRGYTEQDIRRILGGNLLRVWREVEAHAAASAYPTRCRQEE